jgi:hypothetical protein
MEVVERFTAVGPDGNRFRVVVLQSRIDTSSFDGRSSTAGMKSIKLDDGRHVNRIDDNTFEIVETGQLITRDHRG